MALGHGTFIFLLDPAYGCPRFGVLVASMLLSIAFVFIDVAVTVRHLSTDGDVGVNPFWKFYVIFKCASDVIFLDDFKKVVDSLLERSMGRLHIPIDRRRNPFTKRWPLSTQLAERIRTPQYQTTGTLNRKESFSRPFGSYPGRTTEHELDQALTAPLQFANSENSSAHGSLPVAARRKS
ncbi:hypothetical protein V500_02900 [Pseudogymnoascus sp. VKM F-4518 (FW-2643)]|nr:hypothetical protein V500_02900 [Pseudogymnoascus sp. VKM F-4518 (FW-2643)]